MTAQRRKKQSAVEIYQEIQQDFEQDRIKPVYLFYGDESYLSDQLQATLIDQVLLPEDRDFNLDILQGDEITAQSAYNICQMVPMMVERRVVVIRGFDQIRGNKLFASLAKQPNPAAVVLLICDGNPRFNADPYRALKKNSEAVQVAEFAPLWKNQAMKFARDYAAGQGCQLEPGVVQILIEFLGTSLALIVQEIEKLITYIGDRNPRVIQKEDVIQASGQTRDINVFELQDAISQRRAIDAHRITAQLLSSASSRPGEAIRIVAILTGYFVRLWKLHEARRRRVPRSEMAKQLGVPPTILNKYFDAANVWSLHDVKHAMQLLLSVDCEIKGLSKRSPQLIMTLLITQLLSEPLRPHQR